MKKLTLIKVAELAGVGIATVDRVLTLPAAALLSAALYWIMTSL